MNPLALVRLLQLASPTLPVGAFSYSQGLEWQVDCGAIRTEADAGDWIAAVFDAGIASFELPLLATLMRAWAADDVAAILELNDDYLASREAAELRAETVQMGYSCLQLLKALPECGAVAARLADSGDVAFPTAWSGAAVALGVPIEPALTAWAWAWAENQVMAAIKAVPLGQTAGQRLLMALGETIPPRVAAALALPREDWSNFAPGLAIASCRHETQYSRLFRS
ncbi:urease accessory protein UreF [Methyloversatilis discipulorum]|uniref:urease accessory protein UreF n=1 Tax=Methyloversatilis discipulorum TaxID=1119528 RepID=UPI001A59BA7D|nr:urease accessory UreF family protein [Methyloversatilis discipulorum]MBL8466775.1 urease accessory protein UreF [Methyloversatilis discipulorum]